MTFILEIFISLNLKNLRISVVTRLVSHVQALIYSKVRELLMLLNPQPMRLIPGLTSSEGWFNERNVQEFLLTLHRPRVPLLLQTTLTFDCCFIRCIILCTLFEQKALIILLLHHFDFREFSFDLIHTTTEQVSELRCNSAHATFEEASNDHIDLQTLLDSWVVFVHMTLLSQLDRT